MTNEAMTRAALANDASFDGVFWYGVKSTGIYCRPSCVSRSPRPENMVFFASPQAAAQAGYRPCKRCRPDLKEYQPVQELARTMKTVIDDGFAQKAVMFEALKQLGVSPRRAIEIFKESYHTTPGAYADSLRIAQAKLRLCETDETVLDIALSLGFESLSAFYALFGKAVEMPPAAYRRAMRSGIQAAGMAQVYQTPLGPVTVAANEGAVTRLFFGAAPSGMPLRASGLTDLAAEQFVEYLKGLRQAFTVPLRPAGTPFQRRVWEELLKIPYGETATYGQLAQRIGRPTAARAVGMANHHNPIAVLIPCHRVVGANGALTGYAAGLPMKRRLLELESNFHRNEDTR
ncbi:MAG TPA: methylated-DNA--[protein]-cysteine S-methyltransferase [Candidatus Limiplasma sp.]|nr:methylated-DNA--[protein]-cysteine S-methyltransferase [Candidatus Limiplasma sp.]HRX09122.1 methylated-DNA--[protein]-cysteine S-methyltransferase [Candidatus Limiplasma sp.]